MKKKTMLIALVVAGALIISAALGIYGCIDQNSQKPVQVLNCIPSEINKYTVQNGDENYSLVRNEDGWALENNHIAVLKQDEVKKIVNGASMITAQKQISEKELQSFEKIQNKRVQIQLSDGSCYVFEFKGVRDSVCAMRDINTGKIYQMSVSVMDTLVVPIGRFREMQVYENLKEKEDALTAFSFRDYVGEKIEIRLKNASEISQKPSNRYIMEAPYRRDVDDESFEQRIGVKIPLLTIAGYADDFPEDISAYGLDKESRAELNFTWADTKYTLHLGKTENGLVYATKADSDSIFLINSARLDFLKADPFYVLDKQIAEADAEYIRTVRAKKGDTTYSLSCTAPKSDKALYYVNGKAASKYVFDTLAAMISELKITKALLTVPKQKDPLELDISYANMQSTQRLRFVLLNDKEYALFINNTAEFAVDKSAVDSLFAELEAISKNPMQTGKKG